MHFIFLVIIIIPKMDKTASNDTSLKPADGFAIENTQEKFGDTQYNSSVVQKFAKLNIEKASNKIDRIALKMFNVFVQSS